MAKAILRKRYAADDFGYIAISIPVPGAKPVERPLGIKIVKPGKFWDAKTGRMKKGYINGPDTTDSVNTIISQELALIETEVQQIKLNKKEVGRQAIKAVVSAPVSGDAIKFMEAYISECAEERKGGKPKFAPAYIKTLDRVKNRIIDFSGPTLSFSDITYNYMKRLEQWMSRGMNPETTVPTTLSKFKAMLLEASRRGLFNSSQIAEYKIPSYVGPARDYLTLEEVKTILDALKKGLFNAELEVVAAYFLIECTAGLRNSDWARFQIEKAHSKEAIKVVTQKTGQPVYIYLDNSPILKETVGIIRSKGLKYTFTNQHTNRLLKAVGAIAGIKNKVLTTHVGRHTCATLWLELGYSKEMVAEVLGVSRKTVDVYAKVTRRKLQGEYDKLGGI